MNYYFILRSKLFDGLTKEQIQDLLPSLGARTQTFQKDEIVFHAGEEVREIGLILEGDVRIEHSDPWGNISILTIMVTGKTIGESQACSNVGIISSDYIADNKCTILFLDADKIINPGPDSPTTHGDVARNLLKLLAQRNLEISRRIYVTAPHRIRDKVMGYLSLAAVTMGKTEFEIPYTRDQLAQYLGVDRTALSSELSRMQKDGLICYKKNHFKLLVVEEEL